VRWSAKTKRAVVLVIVALVSLVLYLFRVLVPPLTVAFLLAFVLEPVVVFMMRRLRLSRKVAAAIVFAVLVVLVLGGAVMAPVTLVSSVQRAIESFQLDATEIVDQIGAFMERPLVIGVRTYELGPIYQDLAGKLTGWVGSVAQGTFGIVIGVASGVVWLIFVLLAAYYFVRDGPYLLQQVDNLAPVGYRKDVTLLRRQITQVWAGFVRGQLVLCGIVGGVTVVVGLAIGLPYAPLLGLLAGLLEIIPNIGPVLATVPAVLLALLSGSTILRVENFWFAVLVVIVYILIQQVENSFLRPRIMGRHLHMHPLLVLTGVIVGASLGGLLGMFLAAPIIATLLVLARYVINRLYDRDPFVEADEKEPAPEPGLLLRAGDVALQRLQQKLSEVSAGAEVQDEPSTSSEDDASK